MTQLNTQEKCIKYLEDKKWQGVPVCPYCRSEKSSPKLLRHTCLACNYSYSVTIGTVFQDSNIPLYKWFTGIVLILSAKKGISSLQLSRDLSVNKNTAWLLQKKLRAVMKEEGGQILDGIIEADETFVGAKVNNHYPQRKKSARLVRGGNNHLKPVLGMVQREGKVVTKVIEASVREQVMPVIRSFVSPSSTLVTDASTVYYTAKKHFNDHQVLSRSAQHFKEGIYHTSTIEGFWSLVKRAIIGQYHKISAPHLQSYMDEMCFKYNHRHLPDKGFDLLLQRLTGSSLAEY